MRIHRLDAAPFPSYPGESGSVNLFRVQEITGAGLVRKSISSAVEEGDWSGWGGDHLVYITSERFFSDAIVNAYCECNHLRRQLL